MKISSSAVVISTSVRGSRTPRQQKPGWKEIAAVSSCRRLEPSSFGAGGETFGGAAAVVGRGGVASAAGRVPLRDGVGWAVCGVWITEGAAVGPRAADNGLGATGETRGGGEATVGSVRGLAGATTSNRAPVVRALVGTSTTPEPEACARWIAALRRMARCMTTAAISRSTAMPDTAVALGACATRPC